MSEISYAYLWPYVKSSICLVLRVYPLPDLRRGKGSSNRVYSILHDSWGTIYTYLLYAYGAWFYFTSARDIDTACSLVVGTCTEKILH